MERKKSVSVVDRYQYVGEGSYLVGLPARDLKPDEWAAYPDKLTETALKLGLYVEIFTFEKEGEE